MSFCIIKRSLGNIWYFSWFFFIKKLLASVLNMSVIIKCLHHTISVWSNLVIHDLHRCTVMIFFRWCGSCNLCLLDCHRWSIVFFFFSFSLSWQLKYTIISSSFFNPYFFNLLFHLNFFYRNFVYFSILLFNYNFSCILFIISILTFLFCFYYQL